MKNFVWKLAAALSASVLAACATDAPTDVGGSLLANSDLVTFEVQLPASAFLVFDSSFAGYAKATDANFQIVANKYDGATDANSLLRFSLPPTAITVRTTTGSTTVADTLPKYFAGRLVLHLDTTVSVPSRPAHLTLYRTGETWDASATWFNRVDSINVKTPWTTPGGTRGILLDTATWAAADSVAFNVDSTTLAQWRDTSNAARGAIVAADNNGSFVRVLGAALHVSAHSTVRPDTVVIVDLVPTVRTFVSNPTLPSPASSIRVGGIPAWRSILKFRSDLAGAVYPCGSAAPAGCTIKLDSVHLSVAQLLLKPSRPPAGFAPEDSMVIESRIIQPNATVPLSRAALGNHIGYSSILNASLLTTPSSTDQVKVDITSFIAHQTNANVTDANRLPPYMALLQIPEPSTYGIASFDLNNLVLRLVLTANVERKQ